LENSYAAKKFIGLAAMAVLGIALRARDCGGHAGAPASGHLFAE
jgi:hypothetical protein